MPEERKVAGSRRPGPRALSRAGVSGKECRIFAGSWRWIDRPTSGVPSPATARLVLPFVTYAVSGIAGIRDDYVRSLTGATGGEGLAVRREDAAGAGGEVEQWLRRNELL